MRKYRFNPKEVGLPIGYAVLPIQDIFELLTYAEFQTHFHDNPLGWSPQEVCRQFLKAHPFPYFSRHRISHSAYSDLQYDFDISRLDPLLIEFDGGSYNLRDGNHRAFFFLLLYLDNRLSGYPDEMRVIFTSHNYVEPIVDIKSKICASIGKGLQLFEECWVSQ